MPLNGIFFAAHLRFGWTSNALGLKKITSNSTSACAPAPQGLGRGGWWMLLLCLDTGEAFFSCQCRIWWTQLFSFISHLGLNYISAGTCPVLINIKLPDHPFELEQFLTANRAESQIFEWLVAGWERWMLGELNDSWPDPFTMVRVVGMSQLRFLWQKPQPEMILNQELSFPFHFFPGWLACWERGGEPSSHPRIYRKKSDCKNPLQWKSLLPFSQIVWAQREKNPSGSRALNPVDAWGIPGCGMVVFCSGLLAFCAGKILKRGKKGVERMVKRDKL